MWIVRLAMRNLVRNLRRTLISGSAISFTVALVLVGANFEYGTWQDRLEAGITAVSGHVVLQAKGYVEEPKLELVVEDTGQAADAMREAIPEARVVRRAFIGGMLSSPRNTKRVMVQGIEPEHEQGATKLDDAMALGEDGKPLGAWFGPEDNAHILIGRAMADQLQVGVGDKVVLMTQVGEDVENVPLRVQGIFDTGMDTTDGFVALAPLVAVQPLLPGDDPAHQIAVQIGDVAGVGRAYRRLEGKVEREGAVLLAWQDAMPKLYTAMRADRDVSAYVYGFIGVIVAIVILTTMLMSVLERRREFGVLLALGMRPTHLVLLILTESLFLGIVATAAGVLIHAPFTAYLMLVGVDMGALGAQSTDVAGAVIDTTIRARVDWNSIVFYSVGSVLLTVLAGVWPAWRATRLTPVDAMRGV